MLFLLPIQQCQRTVGKTTVYQQEQQQHLFNGPLSWTTWVSQYLKGKTNLDLLEQETVSGSGISWAVCKSAPCSRTNNYNHASIPPLNFLPQYIKRLKIERIALKAEQHWHNMMMICLFFRR